MTKRAELMCKKPHPNMDIWLQKCDKKKLYGHTSTEISRVSLFLVLARESKVYSLVFFAFRRKV